MKIALATPPFPKSISDGLFWVEKLVKEAAAQQAEIVCFPESYLPGYPVMEEYLVEEATPLQLQAALERVCRIAADNAIAIIIPMDWYGQDGLLNVAQVISSKGEVLGYQTKNQLDPSEDNQWVPGTKRNIFEVNGVKFGIVICHEGFRYPETVRWAARNGARIVFHPHFAGSDAEGTVPTEWGSMNNPYYEKAMMMRSIESTVYFASVNYTTKYPESATSLIAPDGKLISHYPYGKVGVLVADIDPALATGHLANRLRSGTYI
jgi:predicted amidohydrolase